MSSSDPRLGHPIHFIHRNTVRENKPQTCQYWYKLVDAEKHVGQALRGDDEVKLAVVGRQKRCIINRVECCRSVRRVGALSIPDAPM